MVTIDNPERAEQLKARIRRTFKKYGVTENPQGGDTIVVETSSTELSGYPFQFIDGLYIIYRTWVAFDVPRSKALLDFVDEHSRIGGGAITMRWMNTTGEPTCYLSLFAEINPNQASNARLEKSADAMLELSNRLTAEVLERFGGRTYADWKRDKPRPSSPIKPTPSSKPTTPRKPKTLRRRKTGTSTTGSGQSRGGAFDYGRFCSNLRAQVLGQDEVIDRIADRLVVTRQGLDTRAHRPDGVFLLAGPTGTGKTALALAMAKEIYGSEDAVIRLDMSEYHDTHTAANLVGSPPGYVGSENPDPWLTTRINKKPNSVLILDEIEKAHPKVWDTFLQVFDAGRLTDQQGGAANFENVIIIMTTNIGAENFRIDRSSAGVDHAIDQRVAAVLDDIKGQMRPEFVNRMDAILVFRPLSPEVVRSIAEKQVGEALDLLNSKGWSVTADSSVIDVIATLGYEPEHGARPIQRTVEHYVTTALAKLGQGKYRLTAKDGKIVVT